MQIAKKLWDEGINAEFMYKAKPRSQNQFDACDRGRVPLAVWVGKECREEGVVKVRNMTRVEDGEEREVAVKVEGVVEEVRRRLKVLEGLGVEV